MKRTLTTRNIEIKKKTTSRTSWATSVNSKAHADLSSWHQYRGNLDNNQKIDEGISDVPKSEMTIIDAHVVVDDSRNHDHESRQTRYNQIGHTQTLTTQMWRRRLSSIHRQRANSIELLKTTWHHAKHRLSNHRRSAEKSPQILHVEQSTECKSEWLSKVDTITRSDTLHNEILRYRSSMNVYW